MEIFNYHSAISFFIMAATIVAGIIVLIRYGVRPHIKIGQNEISIKDSEDKSFDKEIKKDLKIINDKEISIEVEEKLQRYYFLFEKKLDELSKCTNPNGILQGNKFNDELITEINVYKRKIDEIDIELSVYKNQIVDVDNALDEIIRSVDIMFQSYMKSVCITNHFTSINDFSNYIKVKLDEFLLNVNNDLYDIFDSCSKKTVNINNYRNSVDDVFKKDCLSLIKKLFTELRNISEIEESKEKYQELKQQGINVRKEAYANFLKFLNNEVKLPIVDKESYIMVRNNLDRLVVLVADNKHRITLFKKENVLEKQLVLVMNTSSIVKRHLELKFKELLVADLKKKKLGDGKR